MRVLLMFSMWILVTCVMWCKTTKLDESIFFFTDFFLFWSKLFKLFSSCFKIVLRVFAVNFRSAETSPIHKQLGRRGQAVRETSTAPPSNHLQTRDFAERRLGHGTVSQEIRRLSELREQRFRQIWNAKESLQTQVSQVRRQRQRLGERRVGQDKQEPDKTPLVRSKQRQGCREDESEEAVYRFSQEKRNSCSFQTESQGKFQS